MKRISLVFLVFLVFLVNLEAKVTVTNLRTERLESPMSLDTPTPRFGWQIVADAQGVMQTAYHIIVASTPEKAERCEGDLWDANVKSSQSQWVRYEGRQLRSNTRGYWRISVETNKGKSEWSNVAMFNIGLLNESDWQGQWIGMDHANAWDKEEEHSQLSARYLRTEFETGKEPICQATLYVSGLGMYEAFINGQKVGDDVLAPAPTDYRKTVLYNAYDVTSLLSPDGAKTVCLSVVLGNGRYYTMQQKKKPYKIANFGYPKLRLNLIIEYTDGTRKVISSSDKWKINADGAIRSNNEYDGEIYDATKALTDWTKPGFDDSRWEKAERVAIPLGTLRGAMSPNMKVVKTLQPKTITQHPTPNTQHPSTVIVDFGQNFAGWLSLRLNGTKAGDTITIRYAEKLDADGNLWRENFRHALSTDRYIADGKENNTWWHPTFVYHGGRYAEIKGLRSRPLPGDFIAEIVSDAIPSTGTFETTDTILQKVFHNAYWGVLANYKGLPVDCPQRDERQPWLGDRTRGCYGEAFLFDNNTLYAKWARDITEAQREDGCIPDVAPAFWNYYSDNVTWPAALPMALDMMIRQYGDEQPMRKFYPDVKRWLEHLKYQYQQDGLMPRDKYGDWCVPPEREELIHSEDPARVTDGTLIATAYYYRINRMMADFARKQGLTADAQQFTDEAALTKEAFNKKFLTVKRGTTTVPGHILYPDSTFYGNNTVTANLLPLTFGMIDDDYVKQEVEKNIIKNIITDNGGHVSCGVIGISWLMHGLTDMGRSDVAWHLATNGTHYRTTLVDVPEEQKPYWDETIDLPKGCWTAGNDAWASSGTSGYQNRGTFYLRGEHKDLYNLYIFKYAGVDENTGLPMYWHRVTYADVNKGDHDGRYASYKVGENVRTNNPSDASRYEMGTATPDWIGGFSTSFRYKDFDLSIVAAYQLGGKFLSVDYGNELYSTSSIAGSDDRRSLSRDVIGNTWTPENKGAYFPMQWWTNDSYSIHLDGATFGGYNWTDMSLFSASYLRIKNITFGYTMPKELTEKVGIGRLRAYLSLDNMFLFSKKAGLDPSLSTIGGMEVGARTYPQMKTVTLGLNLEL